MAKTYVPRHFSLQQRLAHYSKAGRNGCILWTGSTDSKGRGHLKWKGSILIAPRLAWIIKHGEPPADKPHVLHRCDDPLCINVDHLWCGTPADNAADRDAKGRRIIKLTAAKALAIFKAKGTLMEIAKRHNVSFQLVSQIKRKDIWRNIHD